MPNLHEDLCAHVARQGARGATPTEVHHALGDPRKVAGAWDLLVGSGYLVATGEHRQIGDHTERVYVVGPGERQRVEPPERRYSPGQPRDSHGRWTTGGAGAAGSSAATSADWDQRTAMVEERVNDALAHGQATDARYATNLDKGVWSPERAAIHKQIVNDLYRKAAGVPREGRAVVAGGLGGAGKSTVLRDYAHINASRYLTLNPDDVKEVMAARGLIPKVKGLSPMETAALVHEESSHITNLLAKRAYADGKNVIWDITMASRGSVQRRIDEMRAAGYRSIDAVFVDIPVETSVQRAMARYQRGAQAYEQGKGFGGRYVPPSIIRKNASRAASSKNRETFDALRGQFDGWSLYDNSGSAPRLVAQNT